MHAISMSVDDACRFIGIKRTKLFQLLKDNSLTRVRLGGKTLVLTSSIVSFIEGSVA